MTSAARPADATNAAWAAHAERERIAGLAKGMTGVSGDLPLLQARRAIAELKPGCACAILSSDPAINWDRGQLVRDELQKRLESPE